MNPRNDPFYSVFSELSASSPRVPSLLGFTNASSSNSGHSPEFFGPSDSLTTLSALASLSVTSVSCCVWWRSWTGDNHGIVGTLDGTLSVIGLTSKAVEYTWAGKHPVKRLELLTDAAERFRTLVITTTHATLRLLLEQERATAGKWGFDTLCGKAGKDPWVPRAVPRFADGVVAVERARQGPVLSVFSAKTGSLEVFDQEDHRHPLYVFSLDPKVRHVHLSSKLIFAVAGDGQSVLVLSSLVPGTQERAILQRFRLPAGQKVIGAAAALPPGGDDPGFGPGGALVPSPGVGGAGSGGGDGARGAAAGSAPPSDGIFLWTADTFYEVRADGDPDAIFLGHLRLGTARADDRASVLGRTLGLDLLGLYEAAADEALSRGECERAMALYGQSNVAASKFVARLLEANHLSGARAWLRDKLSRPESLSIVDQRRLATLYFGALLLGEDEPGELKAFVLCNRDFDGGRALVQLLSSGHYALAFELARQRDLSFECVDILVRRGALVQQVPGAVDSVSGRVLLRQADPSTMVRVLLAEPHTASRGFSLLAELVHARALSAADLELVVSRLDPKSPFGSAMLAVAADTIRARGLKLRMDLPVDELLLVDDGPVCLLDISELYVAAWIALGRADPPKHHAASLSLLRTHAHLFRPHVGLRLVRGDDLATAVIYECHGQWTLALRHSLEWALEEGGGSADERAAAALRVARPLLAGARDARLVDMLVACWAAEALPVSALEAFLLERCVDLLGPTLLDAPILFSPVFYLRLAEAHIARTQAEEPVLVSRERLWEEICTNIDKLPDQPAVSVPVKALRGDEAALVFSCGHVLPKKNFPLAWEKERDALLKRGLSVTVAAMEQEYAKKRGSLACPACASSVILTAL